MSGTYILPPISLKEFAVLVIGVEDRIASLEQGLREGPEFGDSEKVMAFRRETLEAAKSVLQKLREARQ